MQILGLCLGLVVLFASSMLGACSGGDELTIADLTAEERVALDSLSCADPYRENYQSVYFEPGSAEVPLLSRRRLIQNAYVLSRCPNTQVVIIGQTDHSPEEYPAAEGLSGQRAKAVFQAYLRLGVAEDQIACVLAGGPAVGSNLFSGYTEEEIRAANADPRSRRADTYVDWEVARDEGPCNIYQRLDLE
ncbi:MAG: hypothetical protein Rubg2KO_02830 [Rubricoccaceae bacterium]